MKKLHEVVGVFTSLDKMENAIGELSVSGFNRLDITILGNEKALRNSFGPKIPDTKQLEDNDQTPRSVNISGEELGIAQGVLIGGGLLAGVVAVGIASGGILASGMAISLVVGGAAGTALGGFFAKMLGDKYAAFFQKQLDNGGLLLWTRTDSKNKEERASSIFKKFGANDVHVHEVA